jgi:hypothetical protein
MHGCWPLPFCRHNMIQVDLGKSLYLGCRDDNICDAAKLEGLVLTRQQHGMDVKMVMWEKSTHCNHRMLHKQEYEKEITMFVWSCLESHIDSPKKL